MALKLSPQVFAITAPLIEERTGLHFELAKIDLLAEKLSDRAIELGLDSLLDYYYYLRYDPRGGAELDTLAESLVIHETYFFREVDPLQVLVHTILPEMLRARREARVWSAGCATGEEPYTLAMLLSSARLLDRVQIIASDFSGQALAKARAGVYSGRSLRSMHPSMDAWSLFEEVRGGMRVRDELRACISWQRLNLVDSDGIRELGVFDVILCRNVLIYFAEATIVRVVNDLGAALRSDGRMLVGVSESLLRFGTLFDCEERGGVFLYRKHFQ